MSRALPARRAPRLGAVTLAMIVGIAVLTLLGMRPASGAETRMAQVVAQADPGADTPQPTGRPEPPRAQRVADTVILLFLLGALIAVVAVALGGPRWSARRARADR